ncbi:MAG: tRNA lysidine(34) synthetase TilS [Proteobacteria bacterium]|nr:tRNA lysidine(34) synthetase TilS [Pseudomonadota bacterium]
MTPFCYKIYKNSTLSKQVEDRDRILISISGGSDSICLMLVLLEFREKLDLPLFLVHFHHGIRKESDQEEDFLRTLASLKNLPIEVIKTVDLKNSGAIQIKARNWRYKNLLRVLKEKSYTKIALGHHLNDLLETQLWRMMRGGSLFSLSPMLEYNLPYIRPLLRTKKKDVIEYLNSNHQTWCEDQSNEEDKYTRNKIRNQILPLMQSCSGNQLEEKFLNLYDDSIKLLTEFRRSVAKEEYQQKTLSYNLIKSINPLYQLEVIHQFLLFNEINEINRNNLNKILHLVLRNRGNWQLSMKNHKLLRGKHKTLYVEVDLA